MHTWDAKGEELLMCAFTSAQALAAASLASGGSGKVSFVVVCETGTWRNGRPWNNSGLFVDDQGSSCSTGSVVGQRRRELEQTQTIHLSDQLMTDATPRQAGRA